MRSAFPGVRVFADRRHGFALATLRQGGTYHLWGHSWEVDARGDWQRLERVLEYVSRRHGVAYVANGALAAAGEPTR